MTTLTRELEYKQTAFERYHTDANERAQKAIEALGVKVVGSWGGCALGVPDDELAGENGFEVEATEEQLAQVADALRPIIGAVDTLTITEPDQ